MPPAFVVRRELGGAAVPTQESNSLTLPYLAGVTMCHVGSYHCGNRNHSRHYSIRTDGCLQWQEYYESLDYVSGTA
jgi:hypothetical protein